MVKELSYRKFASALTKIKHNYKCLENEKSKKAIELATFRLLDKTNQLAEDEGLFPE